MYKKVYKHLDLFSGIGGFSLGLEAAGGFETVAFCDYEPYCQKVLRKHWPWVTIYDDIKELNSERLASNGHTKIDIITGGYPCQPFSVAGRKKGEEDPRHVWPEMFRLIKELRPTWVIGENVAGHIKLGLDTVLENLESEGYSTRTFSISAASVGANHKRERVWIVGYSEHNGSSTTEKSRGIKETNDNNKEGQDKTSQFERTSRSYNSKDVENTGCKQWPWSFFGDQDENEIREGNANQFERSSEASESDVANSNGRRCSSVLDKRSSNQENKRRENYIKQSCSITDVANSESQGAREDNQGLWSGTEGTSGRQTTDLADTESSDRNEYEIDREHGKTETQKILGDGSSISGGSTWWSVEPNVGRVAHGVPKRVDRLKSIGNSLIPHIPYYIGKSIMEAERNE